MILKTIGAVAVALIVGAIAGGWWMHEHVEAQYQEQVANLQAANDSAKDAVAKQTRAAKAAQKRATAQEAKRKQAVQSAAASAELVREMGRTFDKRLAAAKTAAVKVAPSCPPVLSMHLPATIGTAY